MAPVLEVRDLTKLYGSFRAVDHVSFELRKGQILGLLGPNGAGKTTTIQMLVGVTLPNSGEIRYFGLDLHKHREACLSRINFSSSYNMLQSRITVWENLLVFAGLYGVRLAHQKIKDLTAYFGITHLLGQRFKVLSSGERTRVNLVKALLNEPDVVLPTSQQPPWTRTSQTERCRSSKSCKPHASSRSSTPATRWTRSPASATKSSSSIAATSSPRTHRSA